MPIEIRKPEVIVRPEVKKENEEEKVVSSLVEAAKTNSELVEKLSDILSESLNKERFKKLIIEEVLKDPELRDKVMLELIKKL